MITHVHTHIRTHRGANSIRWQGNTANNIHYGLKLIGNGGGEGRWGWRWRAGDRELRFGGGISPMRGEYFLYFSPPIVCNYSSRLSPTPPFFNLKSGWGLSRVGEMHLSSHKFGLLFFFFHFPSCHEVKAEMRKPANKAEASIWPAANSKPKTKMASQPQVASNYWWHLIIPLSLPWTFPPLPPPSPDSLVQLEINLLPQAGGAGKETSWWWITVIHAKTRSFRIPGFGSVYLLPPSHHICNRSIVDERLERRADRQTDGVAGRNK